MDLFNNTPDPDRNWLPKDGIVNYYGCIMSVREADHYRDTLLHTIEWRNDVAVIFGKKIVTKRKIAWYGDQSYEYTYSHTTKSALPWTGALLELKTRVENLTGETFNSCLLNLYHNGEEGMSWHSDGETDLEKNGAIASLSFGAERRFDFRHKVTRETISILLQHGSLLVMKGITQTHWLHRLPATKAITRPRINLTFRSIVIPGNTGG